MKAIVYKKYGPPDVLLLAEVDKPTPKDDEVLIKVYAAETTKSDCEMRSFKFAVNWFWIPLRIAFGITRPRRQILGGYFAGEIDSVGKDVSRFKKGDQVFGATKLRLGAYGEYMCLPESYTISHKPESMSFEQAAAVPLGGLNALHFLRKARIKSDEKVLINGAGGSIGTFGVQIAKAMGAEVTAVDAGHKQDMLLSIGADHFLDYTKTPLPDHQQSYDVIFDMVAQSNYSKLIRFLNPKGRYYTANPQLAVMFKSIMTSLFTDKTAGFAFAEEKQEELDDLKEMIEQDKIKSAIDVVYPLEQIADAHHRVESEQRLGCVVVSMDKH